MQLTCPRCSYLLEYTSRAPRFCSNCGEPLSTLTPMESATLPGPPLDPEETVRYASSGPSPGFRVPTRIGPYHLRRPLGGGGMGTVYEAEDDGGRKVAVKLIRPEFADTPEAVERFRREGKLASTILHPRCVFVIDADEDQGRPYIVMELMPGRNLADLVEAAGPPPVEDALRKILDVIEGLQEAHRIGVVHRDVKPSNCFLDADGRVKVGDFGLAKALGGPEQLTRTGSFLGTVLYASPEQIRHEGVDQRSDIYSVCATLYYLLAGRAPFHDPDPAAALARAVSDPVPSIRLFRPEVPRTLEEVILCGLARQPRQRWQTLEELRLALLPFVEPSHALGEVGWRVTAYLTDLLLLVPLELGALALVKLLVAGQPLSSRGHQLLSLLVSMGCGMLYFAFPEAKWGCSPGKYLFRLRVRTARNGDRPEPWRSALRTFWFYLFKDSTAVLTWGLLLMFGLWRLDESGAPITVQDVVGVLLMLSVLPFLSGLVGLGMLSLTMRRRNGYRGAHEFLSGTQVIRLPAVRVRHLVPAGLTAWPAAAALPEGVPARVGEYHVRTVASRGEDGQVLCAYDPELERPVWLWLRRGDAGPLSAVRRDGGRGTRPRWLTAGEQDGWRWDSFIAEPGCLLGDLVARRRLGWTDTLSILEQLAGELEVSREENTLPARLSAEQVWVQSSGRVILLDFPARDGQPLPSGLALLQTVAALTQERKPRPASARHDPIHAPIPSHAIALLDRLMSRTEDGGSLAELQEEFARAHQEPVEISRPWRGMQLAATSAAVLPGLLCMFLLGPALAVAAYLICIVGLAMGDVLLERNPAPEGREVIVRERDRVESDRQVVLASWSWFLLEGLHPFEDRFRKQFTDRLTRVLEQENEEPGRLDELITQGDDMLAGPSGLADELRQDWWMALGLLLFWPGLWAAGAGLLRGGVALRVFGIALVGQDGRPAARWRCALRTLLIWLPVVTLLYAGIHLDLVRVANSRAGWPAEQVLVLGWLAWLCWWLALGLLPVYALVAVGWPDRGPHDRIAGTFLVPK